MTFLPFSNRAKQWEIVANDLRRFIPSLNGSNIDPEQLAARVGLHLVDASVALSNFSREDRDYLLAYAKDQWSGGVLPKKLPNGKCICILNPMHPRRRNRITLMEEVVHVFRRHTPTGLREIAPGLKIRSYDPEQEAEAYGVGAAVLLPWTTFFRALNAGSPIEEMADMYDVTTQLVEYRIKVTGGTKLYCSRRRQQRGGGTG